MTGLIGCSFDMLSKSGLSRRNIFNAFVTLGKQNLSSFVDGLVGTWTAIHEVSPHRSFSLLILTVSLFLMANSYPIGLFIMVNSHHIALFLMLNPHPVTPSLMVTSHSIALFLMVNSHPIALSHGEVSPRRSVSWGTLTPSLFLIVIFHPIALFPSELLPLSLIHI